MTQLQFESRLQSLGASEREAELIAANYFAGYWMDQRPTKLTDEQRVAMETLIADRREEDRDQAYITHEWALNHERAGYLVYWNRL